MGISTRTIFGGSSAPSANLFLSLAASCPVLDSSPTARTQTVPTNVSGGRGVIGAVNIDANTWVVARQHSGTGAGQGAVVHQVTRTGDALNTPATDFSLATGSNARMYGLAAHPADADKVVALYREGSFIRAVVLTLSGSSFSAGTPFTIADDNSRQALMADGAGALWTMSGTGMFEKLSISGSTVTSAGTGSLGTTLEDVPAVGFAGSDRLFVTIGAQLRVFTVSGITLTQQVNLNNAHHGTRRATDAIRPLALVVHANGDVTIPAVIGNEARNYAETYYRRATATLERKNQVTQGFSSAYGVSRGQGVSNPTSEGDSPLFVPCSPQGNNRNNTPLIFHASWATRNTSTSGANQLIGQFLLPIQNVAADMAVTMQTPPLDISLVSSPFLTRQSAFAIACCPNAALSHALVCVAGSGTNNGIYILLTAQPTTL
jgi:hypothetical protein